MGRKNGFNKLHLIWIIPIALILIFGVVSLIPKGMSEQDKLKEAECLASGGKVTTSLCCKSVGNFPNTCKVGACGCSPINSHKVKMCQCGYPDKCFDGTTCINMEQNPNTIQLECIQSGGKWVETSRINNYEINLGIRTGHDCRVYGGACYFNSERPISLTKIGTCEDDMECLHTDFREDTCLYPDERVKAH